MPKADYKPTTGYGPSKTQAHLANDLDINNIMAKYRRTGTVPTVTRQAIYGDVSDVQDFQTMQNMVANAKSNFESLPAAIRRRFKNDPVELLKFIDDPSNKEEGIKLGIYTKADKPAEPAKPEPASPAAQ